MRTGRPASRRNAGSHSAAPRIPFALLVGGLLVGGLVLLLALNTASAANELRRSALAGKDQEISADVAQLRNEVAASSAPGNVAAAAQQLGMVPAAHPAFIVELPNGRSVLRGHARPVADDPLVIPTGTAHASPSPTTRAAGPGATSSATSTGTSTSTSAASSSSTANSTATTTSGSTAHAATKHPKKATQPKKRGHRKSHAAATPTRGTG